MTVNRWFVSALDLMKYNWWAFLITFIGFVIPYHFIAPPAPREITMATGSEQGGYHRFGLQLKAALEQKGLRVNLHPSAGTIENLKLLSDPHGPVSVAFGQGGAERFYQGNKETIRGLGSLFYEPFWIFHRKDASITTFADLRRVKIAIGRDGSGTQMLSKVLLRENNIPETAWVSIGFKEAFAALSKNEVQAVFLVAPVNDPQNPHKPHPDLYALMADPALSLFPIGRTQAYMSRLPHLSTVTIGEGLFDLEKNYPPASVTLLSPLATLLAREDLNGDIAILIIQTCREIRESGGWLEKAGEFPSRQGVTFPLLPEAAQFYQEGPSFFYRFLPFWAANMLNRLWIMAIPLVALVFPLVKLAPPIYHWRIRRKIATKYYLLMEIDDRIAEGSIARTLDTDIAQLMQYEDELARLSVPIMYAADFYSMRSHVRYLRGRLEEVKTQLQERAGIPP